MAKTKREIQKDYEKKTNYEAQKKYKQSHLKRIPLEIQLLDFDKLKEHTIKTGESINGFIKRAIQETIESDNIKEV